MSSNPCGRDFLFPGNGSDVQSDRLRFYVEPVRGAHVLLRRVE